MDVYYNYTTEMSFIHVNALFEIFSEQSEGEGVSTIDKRLIEFFITYHTVSHTINLM